MAVVNTFSFPLRLSGGQKTLFLAALIGVAEIVGVGAWWVNNAVRVVVPIKQAWVRGMGSFSNAYQSIQKLPRSAARIQDLELRLAEASASLAELETLRRENEELRFLLHNTDRPFERTHLAAPIIAFAQPAIGLGSQAGVQVGAVVLSRNTLLGQVSQVGEYESQVTLLSEVDAPPVLAKTESGVEGLIVGDGRKVLFTQVAKDAVLHEGERVVTLGQPQIEQDLPIGRIVKVNNNPVDSIQSAIIEQYASFFETPIVEVH